MEKILQDFENITATSRPIKFGQICKLNHNSKSPLKTAKRLAEVFGIPAENILKLRRSIVKVAKDLSRLRNLCRDATKIQIFFCKTFDIEPYMEKQPATHACAEDPQVELRTGAQAAEPSDKHDRWKASEKREYKTHFEEKINSLQESYKILNSETKILKKKNRNLGEKLKRREQEIKIMKDRTDDEDNVIELKKLKKQKRELIRYHKKKSDTCRDELNDNPYDELKEENQTLKDRLVELEILNSELQDKLEAQTISVKDQKYYDSNLRKVVYNCIQNSVPISKVSDVISVTLRHLTNFNIDSLPSQSTVARMAREMGVLADVQTVEKLVDSNNHNATLCWDATTLSGNHVNQIHISTDPSTQLSMSVQELPGGQSSDYVNHILSTVDNMATSYSELNDINKDKVSEKISQTITNTLSDRAVVNHCVTQNLQDNFGPLIELKCNLHPLDSLASKAKTVMKEFENNAQVNGLCFGKDAAVVNLIHGISKMKYKASTGHPSSFKTFLAKQNIPISFIPRYVGNRLHILFLLSGNIFFLQSTLLTYLKDYCPVANGLRSSLLKDIQNEVLLMELAVLGLYGKILTGPWMTHLYSSHMSNLEAIPYLQSCVSFISTVENTPLLLWTTDQDAFNKSLDINDKTLQTLQRYIPSDPGLSLTRQIASGLKEVLSRQLSKYLSGELEPVEHHMTHSAPVHNMYAERVLGMTDHNVHRAPNAKMDFVDSKVRFVVNKTCEWVDVQDESVVDFARKRAEVHHGKRRRIADHIDVEDRLESLITRVGEKSTASLESNLEGLASVLEADLPNYRHKICKILCDCVTELPEKLTVYTTLVGLLNAKNYNAGGEFVDMLVRTLKEQLKTCDFGKARIIVRFLADLVNCRVVVVASLLSLLDNFVEVTMEDNIPQVRSDWYVFAVLSALPWVGRELFEKKLEDLDRLLQCIQTYLEKRQNIHVPALRVWASDDPHPQEEYLECLWAQIINLKGKEWRENQITRPYLAFDSELCEALQHTLPQIIPPSHHEEAIYTLPNVTFRMFDYTDVPEGPVLPGSQAIERYLLEEQLHRIVCTNHLDRKDCAANLLSLPVKNKIPINYMIVEVVFGQLLELPRPKYLDVFYGSLLIELCKLQPGSMPQVLAQATEMLFERLDTMNASCIERVAVWFAYHLSNFQFRWSWEDWGDCLNGDLELPKPKFINEVLLRCMRLSYHQRIKELVPEKFEKILPKKPIAFYKYEEEGAGNKPGTMTAHRLKQSIKSKCTPEEAVLVLKDLPNPLTDEDGEDEGYNPLKIEVFVQTLLHLGAKSFSHTFAAIAKFHNVLKGLAESQDAQVCLLKNCYELWSTHQQMLVVLVDKLLKTQVVECSAVANWIFSPEMSKDFTAFYAWEIMHSTIKKMNKHVAKLQKEVEEGRDKLDAADRRRKDGLDNDDDDDDADLPTEDMVERMEEKLEAAQSEQKNLFLIVFQRFIMILTDHLARCESEGRDYNTSWYKWVIERLQQVFLMHHEQVYNYVNTLESLMFTSDIDLHILEVFQQFCALRS